MPSCAARGKSRLAGTDLTFLLLVNLLLECTQLFLCWLNRWRGCQDLFRYHFVLWPGLKPTSVELKQAGTFVRTPCQLSPQMEIMLLGQWLWLSWQSSCFQQLRSAVQIPTSAKFYLPIVNGKDQNKEIVAGKWTIFKECIMLRN